MLALVLAFSPSVVLAAGADMGQLSIAWSLPFVGILLSIALFPLLAPAVWHHHFGKVTSAWALAFMLPFTLLFGPLAMGANLTHALLSEYVPFILLLTALFTVSGGIYIRGNLHGSPGLNTARKRVPVITVAAGAQKHVAVVDPRVAFEVEDEIPSRAAMTRKSFRRGD